MPKKPQPQPEQRDWRLPRPAQLPPLQLPPQLLPIPRSVSCRVPSCNCRRRFMAAIWIFMNFWMQICFDIYFSTSSVAAAPDLCLHEKRSRRLTKLTNSPRLQLYASFTVSTDGNLYRVTSFAGTLIDCKNAREVRLVIYVRYMIII